MSAVGKPVTGHLVIGKLVTGHPVGHLRGEDFDFNFREIAAPSDVYSQDTVSFTITFTNNLAVNYTSVVIQDLMSDTDIVLDVGSVVTSQGTVTKGNTGGDVSVSVDVGTVIPDDTITITFTGTAVDILGIYTGFATVLAGEIVPPVDSNTVQVGIVPRPAFTPIKTSNPSDFANVGQIIDYNINITEQGGVAKDVVYTDPLQTDRASYVLNSVTTTKGTIISGNDPSDIQVEVDIGTVNRNTIVNITYQVLVDTLLTPLDNQGSVSRAGGEINLTNLVSLPIEAVPTWVPTKIADNSTVLEGARISYDVTFDTTGQGTTRNVVGIDGLDPNVTLDPTKTTTTLGTIATGDQSGDTTIQIDFGDIPPATAVTVHYEVVVNTPFIGTVSNQMLFTSDNRANFETNQVDVTVTSTPLTPILTAVLNIQGNPTEANPGDTIHYIATISNIGDGDSIASIMNDIFSDPNLTLVQGSVTTTQGTVTEGN